MRSVLVVGLGSMGRRRIRLLRRSWPEIAIVGVDARQDRRAEAAGAHGITAFASIESALAVCSVGAAFVCTSPASHASIIADCLSRDLHVFTELNLVADSYDELVEDARLRGKTLFLSSTLLYRRDIRYIAERVAGGGVNYIYHVGQYLPDWHPWEDYRSYFVGDPRTNGCREILAIDLPWIVDAFGPITEFAAMHDRASSLEIDYDDNYVITFRHASGSKGVFCADILSRRPVRRLEVYGERLHLLWDGTPSSLVDYDLPTKEARHVSTYESIEKDVAYSDNIIENAYLEEIESFFLAIAGKEEPRHSFERDAVILGLIDRIESSGR